MRKPVTVTVVLKHNIRKFNDLLALRPATAEECELIAARCDARAAAGHHTVDAIPIGPVDGPIGAGPRPDGAANVWAARARAWRLLAAQGGGTAALEAAKAAAANAVVYYANRAGIRMTTPAREYLSGAGGVYTGARLVLDGPVIRLDVEPAF